MAKSRKTAVLPSRRGRAPRPPPTFSPVVVQNPPTVRFSDDIFSSLESSGSVVLSPKHRRGLEALAETWCVDELVRASARPKELGALLNKTIRSLRHAGQTADLNPANASGTQRQFLHWIINSSVEGAAELFDQLQVLIDQINTITKTFERLEQSVPLDSGRARRRDDERRIQELADIFESAGGKARVYASEHARGGIADTAFRRFAIVFYRSLPIARRAPSGFDNVLRSALTVRRQKQKRVF